MTVYVDCLDIRVEEGYADEDDRKEDKTPRDVAVL